MGKNYPLKAIEALFAGALERPAGRPREAWLKHAAGSDAGLLAEVYALLAAHENSGTFLEKGALLAMEKEPDSGRDALIDAQIGTRLGPYELTELLGEGGFGTVFKARQTEPVRREVALKVIKLGMDTRQVIARFEAERQALAMLDHPCIARVLDAGSTTNGRPYFVMDLASGQDLTRFCDGEGLSVEERCRVFIDLCHAMQHAHQRGIIHRDLKPSNVLASRVEGRIIPKVIDFGIAKATGEDAAEASMFTELGQIIGTPIYMSPEQATGGADIDTRADVYSLGVILYELLTGVTPLSTDDVRASSADLASFLRDFEPLAPSQRLNAPRKGLEEAAKARKASPSELRSRVRGDLDHIVLCALEGDRNQRYESAAALARDVQRALENRPIEARPPSSVRRSVKFVRRHRVAVAAAAAVLAAAFAGVAVSIGSLRSKRDQGMVLQSVLEAANDVTAVGGFEDTAADIERRIARVYSPDAPIIVDALATLADRLGRRGAMAESLEARRRALQAAVRIHGKDAEETDLARAALGLQLARMGQRDEAQQELASAVAADSVRSAPGTPAFNSARIELAQQLLDDDQLARAAEVAITADRVAQTAGAEDRQLRAEALEALVQVHGRSGAPEATQAAMVAWEKLLQTYEQALPTTSLFVLRKHIECGRWLLSVGEPAGAAREARAVLQSLLRVADAPVDLELSALRLINRASMDAPTAVSSDEAKELLRREVALSKRTHGESSAAYVETLRSAGDQLEQAGDMGGALQMLCTRFKTIRIQSAKVNDLARGALLKVLADELGAKADSVCRRDDLEPDAYFAAREAVGLALEITPEDAFMLEAELILTVRTGRYANLFSLIENFRRVTGMSGEHPLILALQAIGYSVQRANMAQALSNLEKASKLAEEPQFVSTPRLRETMEWARRTVSLAAGTQVDDGVRTGADSK
ncbi:Serine/threonine-protein kinase PknB [Planctomycetes bacterium Poly30]|uniref:Serine/threonine-protein kinase PknB n=1 Tax=Saltatorellus ferox TaxID=2528018 RepID=A0A518ESJ3_9BACT|nr:Serine/threonine-protein kinase PknB [Planctomycetes bacterium Poly30]